MGLAWPRCYLWEASVGAVTCQGPILQQLLSLLPGFSSLVDDFICLCMGSHLVKFQF